VHPVPAAASNSESRPRWKDYQVTLAPFAYLLDHERNVVIRGIANDWRQLESLIEQESTLQTAQTWTEVDGDGDVGAVAESREG
jgi:hypothetical protein